MKQVFDDYYAALLAADSERAETILDAALRRGIPPVGLIRDVIGRGQRMVGDAWECGELTVAREHAATAVAEQSLALLSHAMPSPTGGHRVVFACPEGDWHSMPSRLAAEQARIAGLDVTMLGASLPADRLLEHLLRTQPDALALSVTLTSKLEAAGASIRAAHEAGVPVIVGGSAWGSDDQLARALGADLWLADVRALPAAVEELVAQRGPRGSRGLVAG